MDQCFARLATAGLLQQRLPTLGPQTLILPPKKEVDNPALVEEWSSTWPWSMIVGRVHHMAQAGVPFCRPRFPPQYVLGMITPVPAPGASGASGASGADGGSTPVSPPMAMGGMPGLQSFQMVNCQVLPYTP